MTDTPKPLTNKVRVAQHIRTRRYATLELAPKIWRTGSYIETVLYVWVQQCGYLAFAERQDDAGRLWSFFAPVVYKKENGRQCRCFEFNKKHELYRKLGITLLD